MKVIAIIALCLFGIVLDWILEFLCWIGLPFWIANIAPVIIIGAIIEKCSDGSNTRKPLWKWVRIFVFGSVVSVILLTSMPIILRPLLLIVIAIIALPT